MEIRNSDLLRTSLVASTTAPGNQENSEQATQSTLKELYSKDSYCIFDLRRLWLEVMSQLKGGYSTKPN